VSDSFATAPRLDSTTLTLRIYPKPPTDHHPRSFVSFSVPPLRRLGLLSSSFSPPALTPPPAAAATRALSSYVDQPTTLLLLLLLLPLFLPCGACFPIPHSTLVAVARTPREKVTSRSRVSQDPANPSWYKIAPSGSQCRRRRRLRYRCRWSDVGKLGLGADRGGISARYPASVRERERERERASSLMDIAGLYVALGDLRLMHLVSANPHRPRKRKDNGSPYSLQLYDRTRSDPPRSEGDLSVYFFARRHT